MFDEQKNKQSVVFRVDSSTQIGSGHLMRCLALAKQMADRWNAEILFICRDLPGNAMHLAEEAGYSVCVLPYAGSGVHLSGYARWLTVSQEQDANACIRILRGISSVDWLVVDSYAMDEQWEKRMRPYARTLLVIDDLANRRHDCDVLLDQNFPPGREHQYRPWVPNGCRLLIGHRYLLLREEFYLARKTLPARTGQIRRILVFFGGSDRTNETMKTLYAMASLPRAGCHLDVVVGGGNTRKDEIQRYCANHDGVSYYVQVNDMAKLMERADFAIGAGGTTMWERCFLRLPSLVIAVADNQAQGAKYCGDQGLIRYAGMYRDVDVPALANEMRNVLNHPEIYARLLQCMDEKFVLDDAKRTVDYL